LPTVTSNVENRGSSVSLVALWIGFATILVFGLIRLNGWAT
jgi:tryptophan-rich sensory protein